MARNPITSESLTVDFKQLMRIPVGTRTQAASVNSDFLASILTLTPSQIAQAFPDYYKRQLPDVSNFITANIQAKLTSRGRTWDQTDGGTPGTDPGSYYTEEGKLDPESRPRIPRSEVQKTVVDKIIEKAGIKPSGTGPTSSLTVEEKRGGRTVTKVVSTASTNLSPQERALLDTIAVGNTNKAGYWESPGYNSIVGGKTFEGYENHPDAVGHVSSAGPSDAAGRYQFLKSTWDSVVRQYNNENPSDPILDFSPVNQDRAALWLAQSDYKRRTGRNLSEDLINPPDNFGELIKHGLGGRGTNTTWQAFQGKSSDEIGEAFSVNMKKNLGYAKQEAEAAVAEEGLYDIVVSPELQAELDRNPEAKKYFADHPEMAKKLQKSISEGNISLDDLKQVIDQPVSTDAILDTAKSSNSMLGFAPGEEDIYLGGISEIGAIPTGGGTVGSREFGKVYTDPETGKQYPIRGGAGHAGTDFGAEQGFKTGTPWKAHMGGTVIGGGYSVGKSGRGYGYYVDVKFDDGSIHRYAHNDENIAKGRFEKGQTLFKVGASGVASGWAHAHSEVWLPKEIDGKQYTADELYQMSAAAGGSKTEKGLLYRSNPREYWQDYEQQQLALREKYTALQERVENDSSVLDNIPNEELSLLAEKGNELYPSLSEAAKKKIGTTDTQTAVAEPAKQETPNLAIGDVGEDAAETTDPYKDKTVEELQSMLLNEIKTGDPSTAENFLKREALGEAIRQKRVEAEVPKKALGGSLYGLNEDMTLVETATGKPIAQIGHNERFEKQGNAVQVTPETKLKADELTDKYDISEMETQISEVEDRLMQQQQNNQMNQKPREPERIKNEPEQRWHEMSAQISPLAPPYERAIARAKFLPEGYHYGRGMHSSIT